MSEPRLHAVLVARNEADRYLDAVLWSLPTDSIHLFDDRSTDDTVALAESHGVEVTLRPEGTCSFAEHEGWFRQAAWTAFEARLKPEPEDWVLAVDCDEFLVALGDVRGAVRNAIHTADAMWAAAVRLPIPEVFEVRQDGPHVRMDGYWGTLSAPRLFRYRHGGRFNPSAIACGSEPTYVALSHAASSDGLALAHYGYATKEDRRAKYDRYMAMANHGHNPAHIQSILSTPVVRPLEQLPPVVWRGRRQSMREVSR